MPIAISFAELPTRFSQDELVLTPNSRTQKAVIAGYMASVSEGEVKEVPRVLSLSQWFDSLWQELSFVMPLPKVIGNLELKAWLKDTVSKSEDWQLTNELGVAEKVLEAYRNLCQWHLTLSSIPSCDSPENQYFILWCQQLEKFLEEQALVPQFVVVKFLVQHFELIKSVIPASICCVGFNQLSPLDSAFLDKCRESEVTIEDFYPRHERVEKFRVELAHFEAELEFAADLALQQTSQNPQLSIAVVVHQLANHLDKVHQIFSERFQAEEWKPWLGLEKIKYNVSAGQPLFDVPMINVALKILDFSQYQLDLQSLQLMKNSPFIDWGENGELVRSFIHEQVLAGYSKTSLVRLLKVLDNHANAEKLQLLKKRLFGLQKRPQGSRPMTAWIDVWKAELKSWGWSIPFEGDALRSQLHSDMMAAFAECLSLANVSPVCRASQAREFLHQVLRQKSFQLASDRTNVHVLGMLEATGLQFERLILVGFNRENWPQKAKLNPFLPVIFQQKHQMPGSSAEREFSYAQDITSSLLQSAPQVWVTQHVTHESDVSTEMAFVSNVPIYEAEQFVKAKQVRLLEADYHWSVDEQVNISPQSVSGGAYLLSNYAACPFKALSRFYFKLRAGERVQKGVEAKVKGAWLHRAMEILWLELKNRDALLKLSDEELQEFIFGCLSKAQSEFESQLYAGAPEEIVQLEYEKLNQQILGWLEIEKQRPFFKVKTEVEKELQLADLQFRFRVDRIDTLDNEKIEIIDYKTGRTDVKKWLGARPDEAQMPAYVLACKDYQIESLSYAKLKTGEVSREGVWFDDDEKDTFQSSFRSIDKEETKDKTRYILAAQDLIDPSINLEQQWRISLTTIAENIIAGKMPVSPKNVNESCRYCEFIDFCRIRESQPDNVTLLQGEDN